MLGSVSLRTVALPMLESSSMKNPFLGPTKEKNHPKIQPPPTMIVIQNLLALGFKIPILVRTNCSALVALIMVTTKVFAAKVRPKAIMV